MLNVQPPRPPKPLPNSPFQTSFANGAGTGARRLTPIHIHSLASGGTSTAGSLPSGLQTQIPAYLSDRILANSPQVAGLMNGSVPVQPKNVTGFHLSGVPLSQNSFVGSAPLSSIPQHQDVLGPLATYLAGLKPGPVTNFVGTPGSGGSGSGSNGSGASNPGNTAQLVADTQAGIGANAYGGAPSSAGTYSGDSSSGPSASGGSGSSFTGQQIGGAIGTIGGLLAGVPFGGAIGAGIGGTIGANGQISGMNEGMGPPGQSVSLGESIGMGLNGIPFVGPSIGGISQLGAVQNAAQQSGVNNPVAVAVAEAQQQANQAAGNQDGPSASADGSSSSSGDSGGGGAYGGEYSFDGSFGAGYQSGGAIHRLDGGSANTSRNVTDPQMIANLMYSGAPFAQIAQALGAPDSPYALTISPSATANSQAFNPWTNPDISGAPPVTTQAMQPPPNVNPTQQMKQPVNTTGSRMA